MMREPVLYGECLQSAFEELRTAVDGLRTPHSEPNVTELRRGVAT
jgi:hypothetical protein